MKSPLPARAGIGLRAPHYLDVLEQRPDVGWLEVHSENYFGAGGRPLYFLEQARERYPVSLHGVGLSLGSTDPIDLAHLAKLKSLERRIEPMLVSDHLSWSSVDGRYMNDLLPIPYTEEALRHVCARVTQVQDILGRRILIENPSSYLQYVESAIAEPEFLRAVATTSGCGLLLDVNNVYVSATNHGFDARQYLAALPAAAIEEIHLAGFTVNEADGGRILIDTHSHPVPEQVWDLYAQAVARFGPRPTLIEWDADLPPLATLAGEAARADRMLEPRHARAA